MKSFGDNNKELYRNKFLSGPAEIPESEITYDVNDVLGKGTFGKVYKGTCRAVLVAVKVPKKQKFTEHQLEAFKKEMRIWSRLYHPNICLFMGAYVSPNKVLIVTEILEGDLESLLKKNQKISLYVRMKMIKEAAQGIAWLHAQTPKVIHRDVKTSNFLYDKNYCIKVCDFGLSDLAERSIQDLSGAKGTLLYMAPEVMKGAPFNEKADVYSFGIVIWEVLTFTEPFPHHTNVPSFVRAVAHEGERPNIPLTTPQSLKTLMVECWRTEYNKRPSFLQICKALDFVVLDSAIRDPKGNIFWKKNFFQQETVPFEEFADKFYRFLGLEKPEEQEQGNVSGYITSEFMFESDGGDGNDLESSQNSAGNNNMNPALVGLRMLRALMASETLKVKESKVDICTFGKVLDCLGPIQHSGAAFFDQMARICCQPWFFGDITTQNAVKTLLNEERGSFLVRFCNHPNVTGYFFVVSKVTRTGKVIHIRISHRQGGAYAVEGTNQEFNTLQQLLGNSQHLHLDAAKAAKGSQFFRIFNSEDSHTVEGYKKFGESTGDYDKAMDLDDEI